MQIRQTTSSSNRGPFDEKSCAFWFSGLSVVKDDMYRWIMYALSLSWPFNNDLIYPLLQACPFLIYKKFCAIFLGSQQNRRPANADSIVIFPPLSRVISTRFLCSWVAVKYRRNDIKRLQILVWYSNKERLKATAISSH